MRHASLNINPFVRWGSLPSPQHTNVSFVTRMLHSPATLWSAGISEARVPEDGCHVRVKVGALLMFVAAASSKIAPGSSPRFWLIPQW